MLDEVSEKITWRMLVYCYSNLTCNSSFEIKYPDEEIIRNSISACKAVISEVNSQIWENKEFCSEVLVSAEGIIVIAELLAKLAGYNMERTSVTSEWLVSYRKNWIRANKESELKEIERMFVFLEQLK